MIWDFVCSDLACEEIHMFLLFWYIDPNCSNNDQQSIFFTPFWTCFLTPLQWCWCSWFMFMSTFVCFLPHSVYFVSHVQRSVHVFCHLTCIYPVPLKVIQLMELIWLAGRYRLREKIMSGPPCMYGVIALHLILLTGWIHRWNISCT